MEIIGILPLISIASYMVIQITHIAYSIGFWRYGGGGSGYIPDRYADIDLNSVDATASIIIPVRNEPPYILERTLRELSRIVWRRDRLEVIIVSDDSDEDLRRDLRRLVSKAGEEFGLNIDIVFRSRPVAGRAGAINEGIRRSSGGIIFIIDVDSIPSPRALFEAYRYIERYNCSCVVLRWVGYYELATRLASALSTIMSYIVSILYRGRSGLGLKVIPLGSGTIYRRSVFDKVGMWDHDVVQDDYWMGIKMITRGLKTCYIDHEHVRVLVPSTYPAFKIQQSRWAYGSIQALRKGFRMIVGSRFISSVDKADLILYGLHYLPTVVSIATLIVYPLALIAVYHGFIDVSRDPMQAIVPVFLSWIALSALYTVNYIKIIHHRDPSESLYRVIKRIGTASAVTLASSIEVSMNFIQGLFSDRYRYSITPKGVKEEMWGLLDKIRSVMLEAAAGSILAYGIYVALTQGFTVSALWLLANAASIVYTVAIHIASLSASRR